MATGKLVSKKPQVLSSAIVYQGKVFGIRRDEVIEPTGVRTTREMITHPGSVVVLPVLPDGRILLIQQYRYAARQFLWELVAGRMDEGETPIEGAARELKEETGYHAKRLKIFLEFFPTPGFLEEKMYLLLAEGGKIARRENDCGSSVLFAVSRPIRKLTLNSQELTKFAEKRKDKDLTEAGAPRPSRGWRRPRRKSERPYIIPLLGGVSLRSSE